MSECFALESCHVEEIVAAHMETWAKNSLSVQLGPSFLNAFYTLAIADENTVAMGIQKSSDIPLSSWCVGFRRYNDFNAMLKSQMGIGLYFLVARKVLKGTISIPQLLDQFFGPDTARKVQCPENHLGAFGCVGKNFEDVLLLTKLIEYTANELCKEAPACWAVTNDNNKGGKMVMKRANFNKIDAILTKDRTLGIYEFSATT